MISTLSNARPSRVVVTDPEVGDSGVAIDSLEIAHEGNNIVSRRQRNRLTFQLGRGMVNAGL